jgi:hypothetical protein
MSKLKLPDDPTPQQLNAIALAIVRESFEDDATDFQGPEPLDGGGWKGTYTAGGVKFIIEYDGTQFEKWPAGVDAT